MTVNQADYAAVGLTIALHQHALFISSVETNFETVYIIVYWSEVAIRLS